MKLLRMIGCGAVAMTATVLFAQETNKIRVVGLESDAENKTVEAPAELGLKPQTIPAPADEARKAAQPEQVVISADDIGKAAESRNDARPNMANVRSLTVEGMVIPPSSEIVKTLEEAVRNILAQANKQVGTVSSNGIEKLDMPYQQLGDGKSYEIEWRKALRILLTPVGYNFTEDGELVLFGLAEEVDVRHQKLAQERLVANRTPILFTTNEAEGGMELRNAIRDVSIKAGITITTDYMEQGDLYVPTLKVATEGKLSAEEIGKAKEKAAVQQSHVKRTTFDTNGQQIEWRIVLREILNPHDYDFVEAGGVVRVAKRAKIKQWEDDAVAKKPLTAKVIRLYHADPEAVVERVMKIKGILKHPDASLQATRKKDDNTDVVKNLNSRIQTSSGQRSGQSDTTSQVFDKLVRPRTIPAIIAYDVEENLDNIEAKVRLFDIKEKQILIEAIVFQLDTQNGDGDMDGIQWANMGEDFGKFFPLYGSVGNAANVASTFSKYTSEKVNESVDQNGTVTTTTEQKFRGFSDRKGGKVWLRTDSVDFSTMIQIIRQRSNSKLLASPMLVVGDHSEAAIQVSDVLPVPQVDASSVTGLSGSDNVQNSINIQWNMLRTGILMWVSPEITENGDSVRLTAHPQVVSKVDPPINLADLGGKFKEYPVYNYELKMHEMDTRATVPSGATLMFGGLIDNSEVEVEDKVRWLGDIPVIGWFFRSKTTQVVQKNLVIIIRPTILEDTDETGFEANALKEAKSVGANSGRDLKKTPLEGPYSYKKVKKNIKDLYEERVVKPFKDEGAPSKDAKAPVKDEEVLESKVPAPATLDSLLTPDAPVPPKDENKAEAKPDETKPDDAKPDEKKPDEKKTDE